MALKAANNRRIEPKWLFTGEILNHRIRVSARWQDQRPSPRTLRGILVPGQDGGSDFVGGIRQSPVNILISIVAWVVVTAVIGATIAWAIAGGVLGDHALAHNLSPIAHTLPGTVAIAIMIYRSRSLRQSPPTLGTSDEALVHWLTQVADPHTASSGTRPR